MNEVTREHLTVLGKAIQLIEKGFSQGSYARDAAGNRRDWHDGRACSFCVLGALYRSNESSWNLEPLRKAIREETGKLLPDFNDESTQEEVLHTLRKIKAKLEKML